MASTAAAPSAAGARPSGSPFPLSAVARKPWREQALTKVAEQRFIVAWMRDEKGVDVPESMLATMRDQWDTVSRTAQSRSRRGAMVERVIGQLDAVDTSILRIAPDSYVYGQIPHLIAQLRTSVKADDRRLKCLDELLEAATAKPDRRLTDRERDLVVAVHHAVALSDRRAVTRLRDFQHMLLVTAIALAFGAAALAAFAIIAPDKLPMCFAPDKYVVCTTSTALIPNAAATNAKRGQQEVQIPDNVVDDAMRKAASGWDVPLVELVGLLAGAVAAATSLRRIRGSSTPFGLPIALALLKLPSGALTAVLGLLLMRGQFIPGLSALDSSGQIIAWAILLGYSQQLLTRMVDQRVQTNLDNFSRTPAEKQQAEAAIGTGGVPATGG